MPKKDKKPAPDDLEILIAAYRNAFEVDSGKRVIEDLENRFFYRTTTFSELEHRMIFHEGQRSVLCHIKTMIEWDIKRLRELLAEMEGKPDLEPEL